MPAKPRKTRERHGKERDASCALCGQSLPGIGPTAPELRGYDAGLAVPRGVAQFGVRRDVEPAGKSSVAAAGRRTYRQCRARASRDQCRRRAVRSGAGDANGQGARRARRTAARQCLCPPSMTLFLCACIYHISVCVRHMSSAVLFLFPFLCLFPANSHKLLVSFIACADGCARAAAARTAGRCLFTCSSRRGWGRGGGGGGHGSCDGAA